MMIEDNLGEDSDIESLDSDDSYDEIEVNNLREAKL